MMTEQMKKSGTSEEIKPEYEFWLAGLPIPAGKKYSLRMHMKTAEAVYYIEETEISEIRFLTDWERNTIRKAQRTKDLAEAYEESREKESVLFPGSHGSIRRVSCRFRISRMHCM